MRRRAVHIWWAVLGVAVVGAFCFWAVLNSKHLPMQDELWMDLYTGNCRIHRTCMGIRVANKVAGNFSSGCAPGGNLASYTDPQGRSDWIRIAQGKSLAKPYNAHTRTDVTSWDEPIYLVLRSIAIKITYDPVPGFKYDPPNGYTRDCKRQLLLNSLRIARETRDAKLVDDYYHLTVETLSPLDHKANAVELPDVDVFLAAHQASPEG